MKNIIAATALLFTVNAAHAEFSTCGTLTTIAQGPKCAPGAMCPMFMRMVPALVAGGSITLVNAANADVASAMSSYEGRLVCMSGDQDADGILQADTLTPAIALQ